MSSLLASPRFVSAGGSDKSGNKIRIDVVNIGHQLRKDLIVEVFKTRMLSAHGSLMVLTMLVAVITATTIRTSGVTANKRSAESVARFSVSSMFTSHLVLQRNRRDAIWGWAKPGDQITIHFDGQTIVGHARASGKWKMYLGPLVGSSLPRTMTLSDENNSIALHDVLIGEVWLCSGQSNMQYPLGGWFHRTNLATALAAADHPTIRFYRVPRVESMFAGRPHLTTPARWQRCTPKTAAGFSAVAYFFGNALRKRLHVPIGLIEADWGGTSIEAWTPAVGFFKYSRLKREQIWLRHAMAAEAALQRAGTPVNRTELVNAPNAYHYDFQSTWRPDPHQNPTTLFNGMINPLIPFSIRGVIWYQGENNVLSHDTHYYAQLKALILGWRYVWHQGDFPFYIVQIAPFNYGQKWCGPNGTDARCEPLIWRAEEKAAAKLRQVGMIGTMDIGPGPRQIYDSNVNNIHPANKHAVGHRLAILALNHTYGLRNLPFSGPTFEAATFYRNRVIIHFLHVDGGLLSRNGKALDWFEAAGADGKFRPAKASIAGHSVVVFPNVTGDPTGVRFGWSCVAIPNLANKAGLPAMPFEVLRRGDMQR